MFDTVKGEGIKLNVLRFGVWIVGFLDSQKVGFLEGWILGKLGFWIFRYLDFGYSRFGLTLDIY